jgi:hypothetical protein
LLLLLLLLLLSSARADSTTRRKQQKNVSWDGTKYFGRALQLGKAIPHVSAVICDTP